MKTFNGNEGKVWLTVQGKNRKRKNWLIKDFLTCQYILIIKLYSVLCKSTIIKNWKKTGVVLGGDSRHCKSWNLWNKNYVGLVGEKPSDQVFFQIKCRHYGTLIKLKGHSCLICTFLHLNDQEVVRYVECGDEHTFKCQHQAEKWKRQEVLGQ